MRWPKFIQSHVCGCGVSNLRGHACYFWDVGRAPPLLCEHVPQDIWTLLAAIRALSHLFRVWILLSRQLARARLIKVEGFSREGTRLEAGSENPSRLLGRCAPFAASTPRIARRATMISTSHHPHVSFPSASRVQLSTVPQQSLSVALVKTMACTIPCAVVYLPLTVVHDRLTLRLCQPRRPMFEWPMMTLFCAEVNRGPLGGAPRCVRAYVFLCILHYNRRARFCG